jgi:hypothetical protein
VSVREAPARLPGLGGLTGWTAEPKCCAVGDCCDDYPSRRVIVAARGALRAALNHAKREELISRNVAELVELPNARKKLRRRNPWTVEEAPMTGFLTMKTVRPSRPGDESGGAQSSE